MQEVGDGLSKKYSLDLKSFEEVLDDFGKCLYDRKDQNYCDDLKKYMEEIENWK